MGASGPFSTTRTGGREEILVGKAGRRRALGEKEAAYSAPRCTLNVQERSGIGYCTIRSFRDHPTERLWVDGFAKRFSGIEKQALRKLDMLHHARDLSDLRAPPANRLGALKGDRRGRHSIRVNDQWRICFTWTKEGPADVEIVDDH